MKVWRGPALSLSKGPPARVLCTDNRNKWRAIFAQLATSNSFFATIPSCDTC